MANPIYWDHLYAVVVFVLYPAYSAYSFRGTLKKLEAGGETAKIRGYQSVIASSMILAIGVLALWWGLNRAWADLGFRGMSLAVFAVGLVASVFFIALFVLPLRKMALSPDAKDNTFAEQMGKLSLFMPQTQAEENWFKAVSTNAGVTEELIYRGYLLWYLYHFLPPLWAAVIAVIAFGLAHIYQGVKQLPGILLVSAVAVGLYLYTGSLLLPVLFHIFLDALQGHYIARIRRNEAVTA